MNKNITTIYVVRHGESEGNARFNSHATDKFEFGEGESHITELGKQQTKERARNLKHIHFDAVFSSDLNRAKETAEILTLERKLAVQTIQAIRERNFGSSNVRLSDEIKEKIQQTLKTLDERGRMAYRYKVDMESAEEAGRRLITFLREIAVGYEGKTVLVVCHGNIMRSMLNLLGWATYHELPSRSIDNTGYIVLESDGVDFFVKETHGVHKQPKGVRIL